MASLGVSTATLVQRRPLGSAVATADFALACVLLLVGPLVLVPEERLGTWIGFQPAYALSIVITASGVRSLALWAGGLLGVIACYVIYLGDRVYEAMASTTAGNILTYVVYALVCRMFFGYTRRIARDADASRALAAELARREEERRAQVVLHNGVALMRLLTEPTTGALRARLIDQAEVELRRMRSYLNGRPGPDDATGGRVTLGPLVERVCYRFADLRVDTLLDLGAETELPPDQAEALERALESLLLNIRTHSRAREVVLHADRDEAGAWTLTLRDDGVGFDPSSAPLGVGLRQVVVGELRRLGLHVEIESVVGEGTTVMISSPRQKQDRSRLRGVA
ncbi:sensor histidine kinase [Micromonospora marina]|uniref:Signal transduction histidine kinase n=2 Tax=Micromonosporaceae TaxID=28056 RepID=A0A1C4ZL92_9ACTN|nr:Signal transduction histidine kinase [Micromonospora marina]